MRDEIRAPRRGHVPDANACIHRADEQPARVAREAAVSKSALSSRETPHASSQLNVNHTHIERLEQNCQQTATPSREHSYCTYPYEHSVFQVDNDSIILYTRICINVQ